MSEQPSGEKGKGATCHSNLFFGYVIEFFPDLKLMPWGESPTRSEKNIPLAARQASHSFLPSPVGTLVLTGGRDHYVINPQT